MILRKGMTQSETTTLLSIQDVWSVSGEAEDTDPFHPRRFSFHDSGGPDRTSSVTAKSQVKGASKQQMQMLNTPTNII